jgi:methyl-accepting chemotaxis protein
VGVRAVITFPFAAVGAVVDGLRSLPRTATALERLVSGQLDRLASVTDDLDRATESLKKMADATTIARTEPSGLRLARLDDALADLRELRAALERLAAEFPLIPSHVDRAATAVETTNEYLATVVPIMRDLAGTMEELKSSVFALGNAVAPLQGTSQRLGGLVDRLPRRRQPPPR